MISFQPSDDEKALLETIERFAKDNLLPAYRQADRDSRIEDAIRERYRDLGGHLLGLAESVGGIGFGFTAKCLAEEALARVCPAHGVGLDDAGLGAQAVMALGSETQQTRLLSPLAEQPGYALALASNEADPAANMGHMATRAEGGDSARLHGDKRTVYNADRASVLIVLARAGEGDGLQGVEAYAVDPRAEGVSIELEDGMGLRAARPCRVVLDGAQGQRLNGAQDTAAALQRFYNVARVLTAARLVGAARGAMDYAVDYAQDRKAFGKPIAGHQGLAFFMADMEVAIEAARNLMLKAAWQLQQGEEATVASCNAAIYAGESAVRVTIDAVQVFGGSGFMKDMPVERYMRDARTLANMIGTSEDHVAVAGEALYSPQPQQTKDGSRKVATA